MNLIRIALVLGFFAALALAWCAAMLGWWWVFGAALLPAMMAVLGLFATTSQAILLNELKAELGII